MKPKKVQDNRAYYLFYAFLVLSCLAVLVGNKLLKPVKVSGSSMHPTFTDGDMVRTKVFGGIHELSYGDVVVFKTEGYTSLIKRVIALPGDTVQVVGGRVVLNGEVLDEPYPDIEDPGLAEEELVVSDGTVFVLGDNRNFSRDSRAFGLIEESQIYRIVLGNLFGS